jgi:hypothetical protein
VGGIVNFQAAVIDNTTAKIFFDLSRFTGSTVRFSRAMFKEGRVTFSGTTFANGRVLFDGAEFLNCEVVFRGASFGGSCPAEWCKRRLRVIQCGL